jgi:hypothetical protein
MELVHEMLFRSEVKVLPYKNLPGLAQQSLTQFFGIEYEDQPTNEELFYYAEVETADIVKVFIEPYSDYSNWESYNREYKWQEDIPNHQEVWPIILYPVKLNEPLCRELILEGYHRFSSYVEKGIEKIPAIRKFSDNYSEITLHIDNLAAEVKSYETTNFVRAN